MGRSSIKVIGVLFLCIFMVACSKNDSEDELITKDNDMNIEKNTLFGNTEMNQNDVNINLINEESKAYGNTNEKNSVNVNNDVAQPAENISENIKKLPANSIVDVAKMDQKLQDSLFYFKELDQEIIGRIYGKSYKEYCDVPYSDLRYIRVLHKDFEGNTRIGEMIVNKAIAQDVVDIFKELYKISYPIEKMLLIDEYDADDIKSMEDNNTSAFNFRYIEGTTKRSVHSDGLAIDINPFYNPYVRTKNNETEVLPASAAEYADRTKEHIYYIKKDDPCYKAFTSRGFTWGGEWKNSKDYQHFEKKLED